VFEARFHGLSKTLLTFTLKGLKHRQLIPVAQAKGAIGADISKGEGNRGTVVLAIAFRPASRDLEMKEQKQWNS